jgi:uncharacterized protein YbaA (DUF1428 family)
MAYFDSYVTAVPTTGKDSYLRYCRTGHPAFLEHGATRIVEGWGDDVTHGKVTDFYRAVQAEAEEAIAFSWVEWPDKFVRDKGWATMMDPASPDPRIHPQHNPMPFDGRRMIHGGFEGIVARGDHGSFPYVQGFMVPVPTAKREAYTRMAVDAWDMFRGYGALAVLEAWGSDVPHGTITDFYRGVNASEDESVVFSYMTWPSKQVCQEAARKMGEAEMPSDFEMPFDGMRMVWGGFDAVIVAEAGTRLTD